MSEGSLSCPGMQDFVSVIAKSIRSCCGTEGMSDLTELRVLHAYVGLWPFTIMPSAGQKILAICKCFGGTWDRFWKTHCLLQHFLNFVGKKKGSAVALLEMRKKG